MIFGWKNRARSLCFLFWREGGTAVSSYVHWNEYGENPLTESIVGWKNKMVTSMENELTKLFNGFSETTAPPMYKTPSLSHQTTNEEVMVELAVFPTLRESFSPRELFWSLQQ